MGNYAMGELSEVRCCRRCPSERASDDGGDDEKWTVEKQRDEAGRGREKIEERGWGMRYLEDI